jgi:hypothetical protein
MNSCGSKRVISSTFGMAEKFAYFARRFVADQNRVNWLGRLLSNQLDRRLTSKVLDILAPESRVSLLNYVECFAHRS